MSIYNLVASSNESTVVAEYIPEASRSDTYQSEAALEREFIRLLTTQGYEYLAIHDETSLISNLRKQLEALNRYVFQMANGNSSFPAALPAPMRALWKRPARSRPIMFRFCGEMTAQPRYLLD